MRNKKLLILFVMLSIILPITIIGCGKPKITDIEISGIKTQIFVNDKLDLSTLVAKVIYNNDETKELQIKDVEFNQIDTTTPGEKTLEITYDKFTKKVTINVSVPVISNLVIGNCPKVLYVGDKFVTDNITAIANYNNNSARTLTASDLQFSQIDTSKAGTQILTITYEGYNTQIPITVEEIVLDHIKVQGLPKTVIEGLVLDTSNMKVYEVYNNGVENEIKNYTTKNINTSIVGKQNYVVEYNGKKAEIEIEVLKAKVTDLEVNGILTEIFVGDTFKTSDLSGTATYENETTKTFRLGDVTLNQSQLNTSVAGTYKITVTYDGFTKEITITVKTPQITDIVYDTFEREIFRTETFGIETIEGIVKYDNKEEKTIKYEDIVIVCKDSNEDVVDFVDGEMLPGTYTLTFSYNGFEKEFEITIKDIELDKISEVKNVNTTIFTTTQELDLSNIEIVLLYNDGHTTETVYASNEKLLINTEEIIYGTAGIYNLKISYDNLEYDLEITINEPTPEQITNVTGYETNNIYISSTEIYDISAIEVEVLYNDGNNKTYHYGDNGLEVINIDITTAGEKELVINFTANEKIITKSIKVIVKNDYIQDLVLSEIQSEIWEDDIENFDTTTITGTVYFVEEDKESQIIANEDLTITTSQENGIFKITVVYQDSYGAPYTKVANITIKELKVLSLEVTGVPTKVIKGQTLNLADMVVTAKYNKPNKTETLTKDSNGLTISSPIDTSEVGTTIKFIVSYKGVSSDAINILITNDTVEIKNIQNLATQIYEGETYTFSEDFTAIAVLEDSTEKTITKGEIRYNADEINNNKNIPGTYKLKITHNNYTCDYEVTVVAIAPSSISVNQGLNTDIFTSGLILDRENFAMTVVYNNGTSDILTADNASFEIKSTGEYVDFDESTFEKVAGTYTLKIILDGTEVYKEYTITITEVVATEITEVSGIEREIYINETIDLTNLVVTIKYNDGTSSNIYYGDEDLVVGTIDNTTYGEKSLKITYKTIEKDVTIMVNEHEILSMELEKDVIIILNQEFSFDSVSIRLNYSDNSEKIVTTQDENLTFNPSTIDTTIEGDKIIVVSYKYIRNGVETIKTDEITLTVGGYVIQSIDSISGINNVLDYEENVDFSQVKVTVKLDGDMYEEYVLSNTMFTVDASNFDLTTAGEKSLIVKYGNIEKTFNFICAYQELDSFDIPYNLVTRNGLINNTLESTSYYVKNNDYLVGDDNMFVLQPVINAYMSEQDTDTTEISKIKTNITIKMSLNGEDYTDLTEDQIQEYISHIGKYNIELQFTENAIDKYFNIVVLPEDNNCIDMIDFTFKVIDGYNVYNAKDLSVIDNVNTEWTALKTEWGLQDVNANAVILQNSISVTQEYLPATYFWTESELIEKGLTAEQIAVVKGSLKEIGTQKMLYERKATSSINNGVFSMYGNYYNIDATRLPLIKLDHYNNIVMSSDSSILTTHTTLFGFKNTDNADRFNNLKTVIKDISFVGNAQRSSNAFYSGGIILSKNYGTKYEINNTVFQKFYIGYFPVETVSYATLTVDNNVVGKIKATDWSDEYWTISYNSKTYYISKEDNSKIYDAEGGNLVENMSAECTRVMNELNTTKGTECYNCLLYVYGSTFDIKNSYLKSCGGPVVITDHYGISASNKSTGKGGTPSYITFTDCDLESLINGEEPWFADYGATAYVNLLKTADTGLVNNGFPITFQTQNEEGNSGYMNLIVLCKTGAAEFSASPSPMRTKVAVLNTNKGMISKTLDTSGGLAKTAMSNTLVLENADTGYSITIDGNNSLAQMPNNAYFYNDTTNITYLNMYLSSGWATIVQAYNVN